MRPQTTPLRLTRVVALATFVCGLQAVQPNPAPGAEAAADLSAKARSVFGTLPSDAASETNPSTVARVELGRLLYEAPRLSKNQDISCSSCHQLTFPPSEAGRPPSIAEL